MQLKSLRWIALLVPAILMTGCATVERYQEPRAIGQPLATVSGSSERSGLFNWRTSMIYAIDNKPIGMVWSENSKINVVPGPHTFVVNTQFSRGFAEGPYGAVNEINAVLKSGQDYRFVGIPQGSSRVIAYAIDSSGRKVSAVSSSPAQMVQTPPPMILPIVVK